MIPESYSLLRTAIAYVFQAQPELIREDSLSFYDRITAKGVTVPQFSQERSGLRLSRGSPDQGQLEVEVGRFKGGFRFLVAEQLPSRPLKLILEDADIAWECFAETWPLSRLGHRPNLVEANIQATAAADGGDATAFLRDKCLRVSHRSLQRLGRDTQGIGIHLVFPVQLQKEVPEGSEPTLPLNGATATIRIETLLDDPSRIYFEITAKWPSITVPPEVRQQTGVPELINPDVHRPSEYLGKAYEYVTGQLKDFLMSDGNE